MSAIRLRETSKGIEVRVDDDDPAHPEPIMLQVLNGHVAPPTFLNLTIPEAEELIAGLQAAVNDARGWFRVSREQLYRSLTFKPNDIPGMITFSNEQIEEMRRCVDECVARLFDDFFEKAL